MQAKLDSGTVVESAPLEVVRDDSALPEKRAGRKRKLTAAVFEKIVNCIEDGERINAACRRYGLSDKTLFVYVWNNPEAAKRFERAKQVRLQRWHQEWLSEMCEHAKRSPWATAWLL